MEISLLINMKMPTIVGIFILISRENFMLSYVEHEKRLITSGSDFRQEDFFKFSVTKSIFSSCDLDVQRTGTI